MHVLGLDPIRCQRGGKAVGLDEVCKHGHRRVLVLPTLVHHAALSAALPAADSAAAGRVVVVLRRRRRNCLLLLLLLLLVVLFLLVLLVLSFFLPHRAHELSVEQVAERAVPQVVHQTGQVHAQLVAVRDAQLRLD